MDNYTVPFVSRFHFAERYNAGVDLKSESGGENDGKAKASGCAYKNCQFFDHLSVRSFSVNLDRYLSIMHCALVDTHCRKKLEIRKVRARCGAIIGAA
jgi:hypothetical protein